MEERRFFLFFSCLLSRVGGTFLLFLTHSPILPSGCVIEQFPLWMWMKAPFEWMCLDSACLFSPGKCLTSGHCTYHCCYYYYCSRVLNNSPRETTRVFSIKFPVPYWSTSSRLQFTSNPQRSSQTRPKIFHIYPD